MDSLYIGFKRVVWKDDEVGEQAGFYGTNFSFQSELRSTVDGIASQRLFQGQSGIRRRQGGGISAVYCPSGDAHFDTKKGAHSSRVVHNIAGQRKIGLVPCKASNDLRAAGSHRSDMNFFGGPEYCAAKPMGREIGVDVQLTKACDISVGNREQMTYRDLDAQRTAECCPRLFNRIKNIPGRSVACRMQVQINALAIQFLQKAAQSLRGE